MDEADVCSMLREAFRGQNTSSSLIVSNIPLSIFDSDSEKTDFESLFLSYGQAEFKYLKSFGRILVSFADEHSASLAKLDLHYSEFNDTELRVTFKKTFTFGNGESLMPPKPDKQFLISPPASPPVGWEPIEEAIPVVNYDILSALAALALHEPHELHAPTMNTPAIIIHGCANPENVGNGETLNMRNLPREMVQTCRPPMNGIR